jgi:hypothetical protein
MSASIRSQLENHIHEFCKHYRIPMTEGYFATQRYIEERIATEGLQSIRQHFHVYGFGQCTNIYTEIGDASKPRILLGAHYESRSCSGVAADDNASACAVLLSLMGELKKSKDYCFTVIFFDMEENLGWSSLRGSRHFARHYDKSLERVIILDLIGGALAPGFENTFMQFGTALAPLTHPTHRFLHLPLRVVEPFGSMGARSDYDEFRKRGIPFTFISTGTPWYYHTEFDTPDILIWDKMVALTEVLRDQLLAPRIPSATESGSVKYFATFLEIVLQTMELKTPRIEKYYQRARDQKKMPSPLGMALLYKDILPRLRKFRAELWKKAA